MAENSKIEWTDHTFNPWIGCTKVDELCAHCYAEVATPTRVHRKNGLELWGKGKPRHRTSEAMWKQPLKWNREADRVFVCECGFREHYVASDPIPCPTCGGTPKLLRPRVFSASLADWLDEEVPIEWLADFLKLVHDTPNLDWLLLTKRPENWRDRIVAAQNQAAAIREWGTSTWLTCWLRGTPPSNVWIGTSVGTQKSADTRIPHLLQIPAAVRFLSCEPLLEHVDLHSVRHGNDPDLSALQFGVIDWVICGGESGPNARPMHPDWARSLRNQCHGADVKFFFKQWGENLPFDHLNTAEQREAFSKATKAGKQSYFGRCVVSGPNGPMTGTTSGIRQISYAQVGKKVAGRILDGREWNEFPVAVR